MKYIVAEVEKKLSGSKNSFWDTEHYCFPEWFSDDEIVQTIRSQDVPGTEIRLISYKDFDLDSEPSVSYRERELSKSEKFEIYAEVLRNRMARDADKALVDCFPDMSKEEIAQKFGSSSYEDLCDDLATSFCGYLDAVAEAPQYWLSLIKARLMAVTRERMQEEK